MRIIFTAILLLLLSGIAYAYFMPATLRITIINNDDDYPIAFLYVDGGYAAIVYFSERYATKSIEYSYVYKEPKNVSIKIKWLDVDSGAIYEKTDEAYLLPEGYIERTLVIDRHTRPDVTNVIVVVRNEDAVLHNVSLYVNDVYRGSWNLQRGSGIPAGAFMIPEGLNNFTLSWYEGGKNEIKKQQYFKGKYLATTWPDVIALEITRQESG